MNHRVPALLLVFSVSSILCGCTNKAGDPGADPETILVQLAEAQDEIHCALSTELEITRQNYHEPVEDDVVAWSGTFEVPTADGEDLGIPGTVSMTGEILRLSEVACADEFTCFSWDVEVDYTDLEVGEMSVSGVASWVVEEDWMEETFIDHVLDGELEWDGATHTVHYESWGYRCQGSIQSVKGALDDADVEWAPENPEIP